MLIKLYLHKIGGGKKTLSQKVLGNNCPVDIFWNCDILCRLCWNEDPADTLWQLHLVLGGNHFSLWRPPVLQAAQCSLGKRICKLTLLRKKESCLSCSTYWSRLPCMSMSDPLTSLMILAKPESPPKVRNICRQLFWGFLPSSVQSRGLAIYMLT